MPTEGLNPGLLPCRKILYHFELQQMQQGSPLASCPCINFSVVFYLPSSCSLRDLSSLIRDELGPLAEKVPSPNHWTAQESRFFVLRERFQHFVNPCPENFHDVCPEFTVSLSVPKPQVSLSIRVMHFRGGEFKELKGKPTHESSGES